MTYPLATLKGMGVAPGWTARAVGAATPERRRAGRFLSDRAEAKRAFAPVEQLGSVNAAAQELGTTWSSLRKAFARHGLGMPARNAFAERPSVAVNGSTPAVVSDDGGRFAPRPQRRMARRRWR
jgi:hypothetical protein